MTLTQRAIAIGAALAVPFTISGIAHPVITLVLLVTLAGLGVRLIPGFAWTALQGGVGGALAGVAILGVGWRLAMRVVAILEPTRTPELTSEGTMFILIGVGLMMGGMFGIMSNLGRRALGWTEAHRAGVLPAILAMAVLFLDTELRGELLGLGAGPWLNIPMFGSVAYLYGWASMSITSRLEHRRSRRPRVAMAPEVRV